MPDTGNEDLWEVRARSSSASEAHDTGGLAGDELSFSVPAVWPATWAERVGFRQYGRRDSVELVLGLSTFGLTVRPRGASVRDVSGRFFDPESEPMISAAWNRVRALRVSAPEPGGPRSIFAVLQDDDHPTALVTLCSAEQMEETLRALASRSADLAAVLGPVQSEQPATAASDALFEAHETRETPPPPPAGWYKDPRGRSGWYWDGQRWTEQR